MREDRSCRGGVLVLLPVVRALLAVAVVEVLRWGGRGGATAAPLQEEAKTLTHRN